MGTTGRRPGSQPAGALTLVPPLVPTLAAPAVPAALPRPQVIYSHAQARALHHAPLFIVLLLPLLASAGGDPAQQLGWGSLLGSTLVALCSVLCALTLPAALGAARAAVSGAAPRGLRAG